MFDKKVIISIYSKMVIAPCCLILFFNVLAIFNIDFTFKRFSPIVLMPIFFIILMPMWLVLISRSNSALKNYSRDFLWLTAKKVLPKKFIELFYFNITYSITSFIIGLVQIKSFPNSDLRVFQFFSAHLSMFFCVALLGNVFFDNFEEKKCSNGHVITTTGDFCPVCGEKVN